MARKKVVAYVPNARGDVLNWSVMWVVGDRIVRNWYDADLSEAIRIYTKAQAAGKRMVTLHCANSGFPPAERFHPHEARIRDKRWIKGKKQKGIYKYKFVWRDPLARANLKGIWWCPYCREWRRFQTQGGFFYEGVFIEDQRGMYCPMCGISHRDFHVRKWNPHARRQYTTEGKKRRGNRRKRTK